MSEKFEVGEVAEWCNLDGDDEYCNGQECTITGPLEYCGETVDRYTGETNHGWGHDVTDSEGEWFAFVTDLRKRRPPQDWTSLCHLTDSPVSEKELV